MDPAWKALVIFLSFFLSFFFFFEREDGGIRGFLESGQRGTEGLGEKAGRVR